LTRTNRPRRFFGIAAAGALVCTAAVGCSSGSGDGNSAKALPPNDKAAIERVFAPELKRLGVRLTRGALIDLRTSKPSATGIRTSQNTTSKGCAATSSSAAAVLAAGNCRALEKPVRIARMRAAIDELMRE